MSTPNDLAVADALTAPQARRIFLHAQGLSRRRSGRRVRERDMATYLARQGVLQLDTVNVLARAHYLPLYSRHGAYDPAALDHYLWGAPDGHSPHAFEHWGHEASVMPRELLPAMHHRMAGDSTWKSRAYARLERERPGLIVQVREQVEQHGPLVAADLEHLAPRERPAGPWWDASHVKEALEYLFISGGVASSRGRHFARTYDATARGWGVPAADAPEARAWALTPAEGRQQLFDRAIAACGIGTVKDLCDHFRLRYQPGSRTPDVAGGQVWAASAIERGLARWVTVDGWREPALLATGAPDEDHPWHRPAVDPGRATGVALLSPFDPVCWYRPRMARMFGMDYRIEIYTPAAKRVYGYYTLPLLVGDQMVGRFDLKADRRSSVLLVQAAWGEPGRAPGARALGVDRIAAAAAQELQAMAGWLGLSAIEPTGRGDLAAAVGEALGHA